MANTAAMRHLSLLQPVERTASRSARDGTTRSVKKGTTQPVKEALA
ncbi:hypothetical protein [Nonomuraea jiangxiensis]|uniref:Uncharacterized protein n=1 Tax=Nonomuraea jiangxiensis TaxID=633440 RepID=A0A1G8V5W1_9ACTN|nr:hypothetical protein [Nonomuraea jiangxiensis]SDJ61244.1 hypothetical protein SAMN05421869_111202 [Nonomuraea jiangxiensis]